MSSTKKSSGDYAVGYGKPPVHTRFAKSKSGNPSGRLRAQAPIERAKALVLEEAYRAMIVKDDSGAVPLPAIQAILRSQFALAAKGNGPAQRAVIAAVQAIEQENALAAAGNGFGGAPGDGPDSAPISYREAARRIAFLLRLAREEERDGEVSPP